MIFVCFLLDLFILLINLNNPLIEILAYQFLFILTFLTLFSSRTSTIKKTNFFPVSLILICLITIFAIDYQGIILNIYTKSRMAIEGSTLGLSLFFNFASLLFIIRSNLKKDNNYLIIAILISIISYLFFKTKGPILSLFIIYFFITRISFFKIIIFSISLFFTYLFTNISFFRATNLESFLGRITAYSNTFELIRESPLSFNFFDAPPFLFHNWIFEVFWKLNFILFFYIILMAYIFFKFKYSFYFRWASLFILICGLLSFDSNQTLFSYSCLALLTIFESNQNFLLIKNKKQF